jgi:hypothetical protein
MQVYLHSFLTPALGGAEQSASRSGHVPTQKEIGWASETTWAFWGTEISLFVVGIFLVTYMQAFHEWWSEF